MATPPSHPVPQPCCSTFSRTYLKCGALSDVKKEGFGIPVPADLNAGLFGLPFMLADLLEHVAEGTHVMITGVSFAHRDVLMTFICNLRRLGVSRYLVIAAFDDELYRIAIKMSLPVFLFQSNIDVSLKDHAYRTEGASRRSQSSSLLWSSRFSAAATTSLGLTWTLPSTRNSSLLSIWRA
jgi:hypothetical protein